MTHLLPYITGSPTYSWTKMVLFVQVILLILNTGIKWRVLELGILRKSQQRCPWGMLLFQHWDARVKICIFFHRQICTLIIHQVVFCLNSVGILILRVSPLCTPTRDVIRYTLCILWISSLLSWLWFLCNEIEVVSLILLLCVNEDEKEHPSLSITPFFLMK